MGRFERQTGISIADEMTILGFKNDHGGMNGDGEFGMVVTMPASGDAPTGRPKENPS